MSDCIFGVLSVVSLENTTNEISVNW